MSEEMINLYNQLNTNEKRNELNKLIMKLNGLIDQLLLSNGVDTTQFESIKNYDSSTQKIQSEDETLLFFYSDLWNLKNKVLTLLNND